jgi:carboxyl-terminal processing protease
MAPDPRSLRRSYLALGLGIGLVSGELLALALDGRRSETLRLVEQIQRVIESEHVHPPAEEVLLEGALRGMLESLDDHSRYYASSEARILEQETAGVYHGVGLSFVPESDLSQVLFALPGSPAARAGVGVGDRIAELDRLPYGPGQPERLRAALSNDAGRGVQLKLEPLAGGERQVELVPEPVLDPSVRHTLMLDADRGIGYVALSSFTRRTPSEFDSALESLRTAGLTALILDLRGNRGGLLDAAVHVARRFVAEGLIVTTEERSGRRELRAEPAQALYRDLPLVCLIDARSASSSEVLAGALTDHRVACLIGTRTYGKGTVQSLRRLRPPHGGIVKLTTARYRTPSGRLIEASEAEPDSGGLQPDIEVELEPAQATALDRFLARLGPSLADQPAVRELEARLGRSLLPLPPEDAQLAAALAHLRRP